MLYAALNYAYFCKTLVNIDIYIHSLRQSVADLSALDDLMDEVTELQYFWFGMTNLQSSCLILFKLTLV